MANLSSCARNLVTSCGSGGGRTDEEEVIAKDEDEAVAEDEDVLAAEDEDVLAVEDEDVVAAEDEVEDDEGAKDEEHVSTRDEEDEEVVVVEVVVEREIEKYEGGVEYEEYEAGVEWRWSPRSLSLLRLSIFGSHSTSESSWDLQSSEDTSSGRSGGGLASCPVSEDRKP
jgi:hypothetical protein